MYIEASHGPSNPRCGLQLSPSRVVRGLRQFVEEGYGLATRQLTVFRSETHPGETPVSVLDRTWDKANIRCALTINYWA